MNRVLLVEDTESARLLISASLKATCNLTCVTDLTGARAALDAHNFDLLLLDVNLPDGSGIRFCETLRADPKYVALPILIVSGKTEVATRVEGLNVGADDFLTKPFAPAELVARVNARLRDRSQNRDSWRVDQFRIELAAQRAYLAGETETDLNLTPIEFKLLVRFCRDLGDTLSRETLIRSVWGDDVHVAPHTVDTHVSSLRKKIAPHGQRLVAVVRTGYCLKPH